MRHVSDGPGAATFPNGCHVCEVEIDPDTGMIEVVKYSSVNDFGTVINPLIVEGQLHGGVVQGIGQALMEMTVYDDDGQLLTGSFMDYALPRARDSPQVRVVNHPVPATTNPLGVKGCGEAGCAGSLTVGDECGRRRALGIRHPPHRHAGHALPGLAGDPGRHAQRAARDRVGTGGQALRRSAPCAAATASTRLGALAWAMPLGAAEVANHDPCFSLSKASALSHSGCNQRGTWRRSLNGVKPPTPLAGTLSRQRRAHPIPEPRHRSRIIPRPRAVLLALSWTAGSSPS